MLRERTRAEWLDEFADTDVSATPINSIEEAFESPQARTRNLEQTVGFDGTPKRKVAWPFRFSEYDVEIRDEPPRLGEDADEILAELGCDDPTVGDLFDRDVLQQSG